MKPSPLDGVCTCYLRTCHSSSSTCATSSSNEYWRWRPSFLHITCIPWFSIRMSPMNRSSLLFLCITCGKHAFPSVPQKCTFSPLYWFHAWSSVLMTAEGPVDRVLERGMFMCSLSHEPTRRCSLTTHHTYLILTIHWMSHTEKGSVS